MLIPEKNLDLGIIFSDTQIDNNTNVAIGTLKFSRCTSQRPQCTSKPALFSVYFEEKKKEEEEEQEEQEEEEQEQEEHEEEVGNTSDSGSSSDSDSFVAVVVMLSNWALHSGRWLQL
ncbi:hypothetical protein V1477_002945 [Vespula maculifrons]|uniref:Uncharacterized protein n=1 Tax=Vespula maculifrons TaxID=7453 RepID=A0ABD2CVZ2_VESMC